jgi:hypothetical protein
MHQQFAASVAFTGLSFKVFFLGYSNAPFTAKMRPLPLPQIQRPYTA